jgi:hypothetical protein
MIKGIKGIAHPGVGLISKSKGNLDNDQYRQYQGGNQAVLKLASHIKNSALKEKYREGGYGEYP